MSTITVRLFHHPSRTPIAELQGVDPAATLSSLRAMAERHLAAEEACMMRVFEKWYVEAVFGGRKRLIELTDEDSEAPLSSLGIEDYSAVLLEGPLTGDFQGVGQAVAMVGAQIRRVEEQNTDIKNILLRIAEGISNTNIGVSKGLSEISIGISELVAVQRRTEYFATLPNIEQDTRFKLVAEEQRAFRLLSLQNHAVSSSFSIAKEEEKEYKLLATALLDFKLPFRFKIDPTTPLVDGKLEDTYTAVKTEEKCYVILRASQPLTIANHQWAVKIHELGIVNMPLDYEQIQLGMLPKLSADMEAKMGSSRINGLGGWCISQYTNGSYVDGDWQCEPIPFRKGSLVLFDYSFRYKTLTIRCGDNEVVGQIPNAGEELYPAFSLWFEGAKVSFEKYPA